MERDMDMESSALDTPFRTTSLRRRGTEVFPLGLDTCITEVPTSFSDASIVRNTGRAEWEEVGGDVLWFAVLRIWRVL